MAAEVNQKSCRNLCFTLNNPEEEEEECLKSMPKVKYLIWGYEVGEECGTPHLQGYIEFQNSIDFDRLKRLLPRVHWGKRKGTAEQAANYCKKGEQPKQEWESLGILGPNWGKNAKIFEVGEISKQGKRSDLERVVDMFAGDNLPSVDEIAVAEPTAFIKYHKGILNYRAVMEKPTMRLNMSVHWICGGTGTGKTRWAFEKFDVADIYIKDSSQWWDGYRGQRVVVVDDFRGTFNGDYRDTLRATDIYPYAGQIKGSYVSVKPEIMIITCEFSPFDLYNKPDNANHLNQVVRRLKTISRFAEVPAEVVGNTSHHCLPVTIAGRTFRTIDEWYVDYLTDLYGGQPGVDY